MATVLSESMYGKHAKVTCLGLRFAEYDDRYE
jgi:hypothetical protein